ncbi:hypothetical protein K458DRAFT_285376, partial [Lentithecium fluviatile CBS 122367]
APASNAIQLELHGSDVFNHSRKSLYAGEPSVESDNAWDALIFPTYFPLSQLDLIAAGETEENAVQLKTGDFVAATGAYHELHCIRQLCLYIYKDTYYPNLTANEEVYLKGHLDHCLEVLREQIMCSADTSIITFFWNDSRVKPGSKSNSKRVCANWNVFQQWNLDHMIPLDIEVEGGPNPIWVKDRERHS